MYVNDIEIELIKQGCQSYKIPRYINLLHISMDSPLRYHFSSDLILPRFLKWQPLFSTNLHADCIHKAVFSLFNKIQDNYFNTETLLSLFDTYVKSIVNYGCEVWGFHKGVDIETLHLSFLKRNCLI
jgi:hypothetical protein